MAYLRTNYRKDEPARPRPKAADKKPDPGPAFGVRETEFEHLALKNIAGSITVYRVTSDFIVGLDDGRTGP
jgi:hypothetical protein